MFVNEKNYTYTKLNCLKFNLALDDQRKVGYTIKQPTNNSWQLFFLSCYSTIAWGYTDIKKFHPEISEFVLNINICVYRSPWHVMADCPKLRKLTDDIITLAKKQWWIKYLSAVHDLTLFDSYLDFCVSDIV